MPFPEATTDRETKPEVLSTALAYAARGWRVLPVHWPEHGRCSCTKTICTSPAKHPLLSDWPSQATTDAETIHRWWNVWPNANVGLVLGDGLVDIECDPRHGGDTSLVQLEQRIGPLPDTVTWISGGGGEHRLFRVPKDVAIRNAVSIGRDLLAMPGDSSTGVDVRAAGGFAVAPPSRHANGNRYRFGTLAPEAIDVAELPVEWLDYLTAKAVSPVAAGMVSADPIPAGQRNTVLTRMAGHLRRAGLSADEMLPSLLRINAQRCRPSLDHDEVERVARSIARYEPDQTTVAVLENWSGTTLEVTKHAPPSVRTLCEAKPTLRPPLINGILRRGETMNVIAAPKVGKSWLVTDLALAVATGRPWLGYATERSDVLIIDNELHGETSAHRIPKVASARGMSGDDHVDHVFVENLRGRLTDLLSMAAYFEQVPVGRYGLIVLDAFYRFLPAGSDENDNGTMASLYNAIDRHADRLGCSFALIHHSSKGNQSGKAVTDVGAGAGAQSRATDTHLVLRPHEDENAVVLDAAVRSWPPLQAQVLRWDFPVWNLAPDLNANRLRRERSRRERTTGALAETGPTHDVEHFLQTVLTDAPLTKPALVERGRLAGWSQRRLEQVLTLAQQEGRAHRWVFGPSRAHAFAALPQGSTSGEGHTHTP